MTPSCLDDDNDDGDFEDDDDDDEFFIFLSSSSMMFWALHLPLVCVDKKTFASFIFDLLINEYLVVRLPFRLNFSS